MAHWFMIVGKGVVIAACAAVAAWLYIACLTIHLGMAPGMEWIACEASAGTFLFSLIGSLAIGLPIALLVFWMSGKHLRNSPATLAMIVVLAGIMMVLASFVIGDEEGVAVLGVPAFICAVTFGVLGWFWIIRPMRDGPQ